MTLKLHNTLTGKEEEFHPIEKSKTKMFVCGPTVYDYSHLGHGKTYTQFDVIARALRYLGHELTYVVNITDIDDKIIKRATERGVDPAALAQEYEKAYVEDMRALNVVNIDKYARAHDYVPEIVSQVKRLIENGLAYKISDGYYFDVKKFDDYGKLSRRNILKPNDAVSRIDENPEKRNPGDFCLWKLRKKGEPFWSSELGEGRPGWHIEDTAITEKEFGAQYDIHGGAVDLIFPHHEAEIAQMESISGKKPLVRYWLHTGFLNISSEKMSKSLGNFLTIRDVLAKGVSPLALRYYFLTAHYRTPMDFSWEALEAAQNAYRKLKEFVSTPTSLPLTKGEVPEAEGVYLDEFKSALENDLNTPEALGVVWNLIKDESIFPANKRATLLEFDKVLGLDLEHNEFLNVPPEVVELGEQRQKAKENKNFAEADKIRQEIENKGFEIRDTEGTFIIMKK
ncbi:MAG: cysteine--tRNA ligase [Candidatus Zambryskibacteria bacterium RIFCSPHIGHO2_12_FULL_48_10]|uniref:Cysteine--tRNA ligase n=1 Tax=Candidatus Zambryskibacteria bacterium RIFCSPHIGHO2_01_FULL_46_25 TaxID=1802738 RepID=A0A1G2T0B9_9BACT|nr:MAG: cysteine--tRNA ligase [Candidatus Zambryskibacteria bacterium RIFCSPHIGHO2_01_FULL_46_25]OHB02228.1 MAG: cysteine--tRNA ligase [Candidatus Zambryskibacteria bacterium RIFCSPHIGHO2_12_FULL_48_10]